MLKKLLSYVQEYKKVSILTPVFTALEVLVEILIPYMTARIITYGMEGHNMHAVYLYGGIMLGEATLGLLFGILGGRTAAKASTGFAKNLRKGMYEKIQTFSFSNIDKFSTAGLVTRMTTDVTNIQNAYQMCMRIAVRAPLNFLFSIIMCFMVNKPISGVFLGTLVLIAILTLVVMANVTKLFKRIFRRYDELNASVQENVSAIRVVKAFVREAYENEKFKKASDNIYKLFLKAEVIMSCLMPLLFVAIYALILIIVWMASHFIVAGTMATADLTALFSYIISAMISMVMLALVFVMITMSLASGERICQVLEEEPDIVDPENALTCVPNGAIDFNNVQFSYKQYRMATETTDPSQKEPPFKKKKKESEPELPDIPVLFDVDLHIRSGETIGIIGATGCGKSSFVNLISRLYDVTEGAVLVGGHNVKEYALEPLRDAVSVVLQKNELFTGSILDNLRWGKEDATEEECIAACKLACAHDFIMEFPNGYNTHIEQGGTNVSGGQKQRICIARALLKNPKILILDDSTSAVDTATDAGIRRSFKEQIPDVTKLIISQRISSVKDADRIIVMEKGRINGFDTHENLLKTNTIYRELFETQQKGTGDFDQA